jgi:hypothetical protein
VNEHWSGNYKTRRLPGFVFLQEHNIMLINAAGPQPQEFYKII